MGDMKTCLMKQVAEVLHRYFRTELINSQI